jgi:hypothetical protein
MRKVVSISSTVAAILAGSTAMAAATVDVYIAGASAQKNFWYQDLANIADCPVTSLVGAKWAGPATTPFTKAADMSFVSCTAGASPLNTTIPTGATVTFHYSAELGSVWGVADMLGQSGVSGYPTTHIFLTANQGCTAGAYTASNASFAATCGNSSSPNYALYSLGNGANTGTDQFVGLTSTGSTSMFITVQPDIMVADLEPAQFTVLNNWATANCSPLSGCIGSNSALYAAIGAVPNANDMLIIPNAYMNGELFGIIVYPPASDTTLSNLSSTSVAAILQGDYSKWSEVPEVGTKDSGTAITLCRRDHGSGSQVAASLFFTGNECGLINDGGILNQSATNTHIILNGATSAMRSCVNAAAGSIGYLSLYGNLPGQNEADSYVVMNIDGVQANAHNAAAGYYKFSTMTWGLLNPNDSSTSVAQTMLTRAQTAADILSATGGETVTLQSNGQFALATANTEAGYYSVTGIVDTGSASALNNVSSASIPVSLRNNEGASCTVMAGQNTN